jgi:hypothetical protein
MLAAQYHELRQVLLKRRANFHGSYKASPMEGPHSGLLHGPARLVSHETQCGGNRRVKNLTCRVQMKQRGADVVDAGAQMVDLLGQDS